MPSKKYKGIYYVYELPNEDNYVGTTGAFVDRQRNHKMNGRDTSRVNKLKAFTCRKEALKYERELQESHGFSGNNYSEERNLKISNNMMNNYKGFRNEQSK